MNQRKTLSDKQILLSILEQTYLSAKSEQDFYKQLQDQNLELYSRNNTIVGIKMNRKIRFKTLGYSKEVIINLNHNPSHDNRLKEIQRIREKQKGLSIDRER